MSKIIKFDEGQVTLLGDKVELLWDSGRKQVLAATFLRANCPCSACRSAKIDLEPKMFPGLFVENVNLVGSYALQFEFSDGHGTGAHPYEMLLDYPDEV